jgi:hypothetical protein
VNVLNIRLPLWTQPDSMYVAFEHTFAVPLQYPQAESPHIRIIGLENAVDTRNQFSPSQYKGLLSVTPFRTALCILGYDGGPGIGFLNSSLELSRLYLYNHVCH